MFVLSYDEVTLVDKHSCLSIHAYAIRNWTMVLMLWFIERVVDGSNALALQGILSIPTHNLQLCPNQQFFLLLMQLSSMAP